jgi:hypothetical protein
MNTYSEAQIVKMIVEFAETLQTYFDHTICEKEAAWLAAEIKTSKAENDQTVEAAEDLVWSIHQACQCLRDAGVGIDETRNNIYKSPVCDHFFPILPEEDDFRAFWRD